MLPVSFAHIEQASQRLEGIAHKTPVLTSQTVNERTGCSVFFKCENFQRMGAFKFRGAYNALVQLDDEAKQRGVLTFSSGNHAQATALAGKILGIETTIIMPNNAPQVKKQATEGYGATVITYNPQEITREQLAQKIALETQQTVIPPYDHVDVVAGQGTTAKELIEEVGALDYLFVCCGGGGLLSGCAIASKHLHPAGKVIGVEPLAGDDATRSFYSKTLQTVHNPNTIADGARTPSLGKITFPLVMALVDEMLTVTDEQLLEAMFFIWERMKIIIEPTGALAIAGLFNTAIVPPNSRVGIVISGGNVDLKQVSQFYHS